MKIKKDIINKIIEHAKKEAPVEACGYLAGKAGVINKHYRLTNTDHIQDHFSFNPEEQFEALRDARANGREICAVYHSHPFTPARPSAEDIRLASDSNLSYVIVSLAGGISEVKSFKIKDSKVGREDLEIIDDD